MLTNNLSLYVQALLDATHEHMLSWAQFDITCADFKSVVSEVQEMASRDEIRQITDLEALMNPKFDRVANDTKAESELKKTDCWKDYIAKVGGWGMISCCVDAFQCWCLERVVVLSSYLTYWATCGVNY